MKDITNLHDKSLKKIFEKVINNIPVSKEDALFLFNSDDIFTIGKIASHVKKKLHGDNVYYQNSINLNYTNICKIRCPLCAFSCDPGDKNAYLYSIEKIRELIFNAKTKYSIEEVHIVGGINPRLDFNYFVDLIRAIKSIDESIFIVAFTPVEIDYMSEMASLPVVEVLKILIDAGLGAMPGGGAEIANPQIRKIIAPKKMDFANWLSVHEEAHHLGLKTNATMLFNHLENHEDIVEHLDLLREAQNYSKGFKTFVPLRFHSENTSIVPTKKYINAIETIKVYAVSRIFLHNISHIKLLWMFIGEQMAQVLLNFGVDDFGGTYLNEKIVHSAGAKTDDSGTLKKMKSLIEGAGFAPMLKNSGY